MAENIFPLPDHKRYDELREKYREQLLRSVDPTEALLSDLSGIETFEDKVSEIRPKEINKEIADTILSLPSDENYPNTIGLFVAVLCNNRHAHVASVFTKESNEELLSDAHFELLRKKLDDLCTYLDPDCGIIAALISADVFDESDEERVLAHKSTHEKSREIIKILSRRPNSCYRSFIRVLHKKDQEHILYILNAGGSPPISDLHIKLINKQRENIVKDMDSLNTSFLSALVSSGAFTDIDRQRVEAIPVRFRRNEQIVNILLRKSQRRFELFLVALEQNKQEHIVPLFKGITINGTLHVKLNDDDRAGLEAVEKLLLEALERDLQEDEEGEVRNKLDALGIHAGGVEVGSIRIWFKFVTRETLEVMRTDKLNRLFTERYCKMFSDEGLQSILIDIPEAEFKRCEAICKVLMKPEHQQALQLARDTKADQINVDKNLLKVLSLGKCREDAILNQSSSEEKAKVLLDVMTCRPDCEFQKLLNALRHTQQDKVANFIASKMFALFVCKSRQYP